MDIGKRLELLKLQLNAAMQASIVQDRMLGQAREKAAEIQGRINMLVELQQEEKAGENKNTDEKPEKTSDRKPEAARSGPKLSNKSRAKKGRSKWTPEIDDFIRKNSGLKNQEILKRLKKKFGIKTTLNGLAYNISAKGLRKNRLRAAAEAELDDDDEEDLKTLPPPDMPY